MNENKKQVIHDFKESLKRGQDGETELLKLWPELIAADGRKHDFTLPNGDTVELKTDYYDADKTPNFFMERWSNWADKKPGGVWQSSATYFAYYFIKNGLLFVFKTNALREFMDGQKYGGISVRNKGWTTVGYRVPRAQVMHLTTAVLTKQK